MSGVAASKNERLLNLLICLLSTEQFISADRIRRAVISYGPADTAKAKVAFERMFDRDKDDLRELGVVIETGTNGWGEDIVGYRIAGREAKLPEINLSEREAAAVGIATELWKSAQFESAAQGALLKLKASGIRIDREALGHVEPHIRADDPAFDAILRSVQDRDPITFSYRGAVDEGAVTRHLQPWGLVSWRARWYVSGFDTDRGAQRVFRLSRIVGVIEPAQQPGSFERPDDVDLRAGLPDEQHPAQLSATIKIHSGDPVGLRRMASGAQPAAIDHIVVQFPTLRQLASVISQYGSEVEVLEPAAARAAVRDRLAELAVWQSVTPTGGQ